MYTTYDRSDFEMVMSEQHVSASFTVQT